MPKFRDGTYHAARPASLKVAQMVCVTCGKNAYMTDSVRIFVHQHKVKPDPAKPGYCSVCQYTVHNDTGRHTVNR